MTPIPFNRVEFHRLALDAIVPQGLSSMGPGGSGPYRKGTLAFAFGTPDVSSSTRSDELPGISFCRARHSQHTRR